MPKGLINTKKPAEPLSFLYSYDECGCHRPPSLNGTAVKTSIGTALFEDERVGTELKLELELEEPAAFG